MATKPSLAGKLRVVADGLQKVIDDKGRPLTQNPTPKRTREYNSRRWEAANLERTQRALRAIADAIDGGALPDVLANIKTKSDIATLVHKGLRGGGGYYDVIVDHDYRDKSPAGLAIQAMIDGTTDPEREEADRVRALEDKVRFVDIPGFFPTPRPVIDMMLGAADLQPGLTVLEPSAGKGDIVEAVLVACPTIKVTCYEINAALRGLLLSKSFAVEADEDFLATAPPTVNYLFDRVLMNPPFERGQDIDHIQHAYAFLKSMGRLVAIMSEGPFYRSDKKSSGFREWLESVGGVSQRLEANSFQKDAFRKSGATTRMVVVFKAKGGKR